MYVCMYVLSGDINYSKKTLKFMYVLSISTVYKTLGLCMYCRFELKGQRSDIYIVFIAEKVYEYNHDLLARLSAFLLERDRVLTESQQRDLLNRIKFIHMDFYYSFLPYARVVLDTYPYGGNDTYFSVVIGGERCPG